MSHLRSSCGDFNAYRHTTAFSRTALISFGVLLAVGYAIGFSIASQQAKDDSNAAREANLAVFNEWQMKIASTMTRASTISGALGAFARGIVTEPMNYSAPAADRIEIVNDAVFQSIAEEYYTANPGIFSVELQSHGVISQMYPLVAESIFLDLYQFDDVKAQYAGMWVEGKTIVAGPSSLITIDGYGLYVRQPIFVNNTVSKETFWGIGNVVLRVTGEEGFLRRINSASLAADHQMDHAMWTYEEGRLLVLDSNEGANIPNVMASSMKMTLPVGEPGRSCFFAIYPSNGEVTDAIEGGTIALIVVVVYVGACLCVGLYALVAYLYFRYRHRRAPVAAPGTPTYMALLTLRGAQAVVEQSPAEAQRLFAHYFTTVRAAAARYGCYAVTAVGDRCLYVVGSDPSSVLLMAKECVSSIHLITAVEADTLRNGGGGSATPQRGDNNNGTSPRKASNSAAPSSLNTTAASRKPSIVHRLSNFDDDRSTTTINSIVRNGTALVSCHCSAAVRALSNTTRHYDASSDVYFYGTARDLSRAGGLLDQLGAGELAWTDGVDGLCTAAGLGPLLTDLAAGPNCASRRIKEKGRTAAVCVQWWNTGDSEEGEADDDGTKRKKHFNTADGDSDEPSIAMTLLGDTAIKRLSGRNGRGITTNGRARRWWGATRKRRQQQQKRCRGATSWNW